MNLWFTRRDSPFQHNNSGTPTRWVVWILPENLERKAPYWGLLN